MANLNIPPLFSNQRWQECFEQFFESLSSHAEQIAHLRRLVPFFQGRNPETIDQAAVEAYCKETTSYHGKVSIGTEKRRRATIRAFYDHALACGIYQGDNPARPVVVDKPAVPILFSDEWQTCLEHFLQDLYQRSQSRATVATYGSILARFFGQGKKSPEDYTRADVARFLQQPCASNGKEGQPAATSTINLRRSVIRVFYDFASGYTVEGLDGHPTPLFQRANPTAGIRHGQPSRVFKSLSLQEVKTFFSVIPDSVMGARDRAIFWTFLLTCRRRSEIARLRWGDIEYGTITDEDGSSHEGYLYHFTGKGRSTIQDQAELPQKAIDEIRHYLQVSGRSETIKPEQPVFAALGPEIGGNVRPGEIRPLSGRAMSSSLKKYARLANIDEKKFSLHSLRHTGAFLRKISGSDLFSISHTLRHKSLDMTRRYLEELVTSGDRGSKLVEAKLAAMGVM